jgi:hypothetical protein
LGLEKEALKMRLIITAKLPTRPLVVLGLALLGSAAWALWSTLRFSGEKRTLSYLYYVPIAAPFVAFLLERLADRSAALKKLFLLDAIVTILAMWRVIGDVPFISGHALFLTYAVVTARRWVVFALSAFVLIETLYLKFVVWNDIATAAIGAALGGALAVVYWWAAPSFTHVLASNTGASN